MPSFKDTRDFLLLSYDCYEINNRRRSWSLFDTCSSPSLDLPYDSFPPFDLSLLNEKECSVQFSSVSDNRILFIIFSMSAFFDEAGVVLLTGKQHYNRNSIHPSYRMGR